MKTKVYKLLSILLTLAILATTSICVISTVTAEESQVGGETAGEEGGASTEIVYPENSYFISAKGKTVPNGQRPEGLGTLEKPVKTFADVTKLIKADGYDEDDTVYVFIKSGEQVEWKDLSSKDTTNSQPDPLAYTCNLIIDSTDPEVHGKLYEYDFLDVVGNMTIKNIDFTVEYMYGCARLNHHNVVFDEGSVASFPEFFIGAKGHPSKYNKEVNLEIKGQFKTNKFFIMSNYGKGSYEKDINILVDNENAMIPLLLTGYRPDNVFTYNGNINITVNSAKSLSFANHQGTSIFNGALQLMVSSKVKLPYAVKTNFDAVEIAGGKWYITTDTAEADFVQFSDVAGKFNIKNGAKSYVRQFGGKLITETDGVVDLSAKTGAYTISDKAIPELKDESHKMLHFKCPGGTNYVMSRAAVTPGKTYRFQYSIFTSHYEDSFPTCRIDGDRQAVGDDMKIISNKPYKNYYKVVAEITIPDNYSQKLAFFGVCLASSSEGVVFDWNVYDVEDAKTNLLRNAKFHSGLDEVALNFDFWGGIYTDERGGSGLLEWSNGTSSVEVMNFDSKFIDHLIYLADPDDGEWWNPEDYIEETFETYAKAQGVFVDENDNGIKGVKFVLVSEDKTYTDKTNSKGEFNFGKILTGLYELYYIDGGEKISTGFSSYIAQDDFVKITIVSDMSSLKEELEEAETEEETEEEEVIEIIPTGNFTGTVYTPQLQTVPNLKVILEGVGDVVTDENGSFGFANVPVGSYELYTILADGSKYVIKQVEIQENIDIASKLKFDPQVESDEEEADNGWIIWVIVASIAALVIVGVVILLLVLKKKKV